ncbi:MAG: hypothetical protein JXR64_08420 [Spirochaetales bacterium]|nr:hypothetical protein [Spirochaetales bacterium]
MKKVLFTMFLVLINFYSFSFTLLQDFGLVEYNNISFLSYGEVLDISNDSYIKSPIDGKVYSFIENKLEGHYGKFEANNLLLIEGNSKNIIGIYNLENKSFKVGDKITKNQILGKKKVNTKAIIFIYLEYFTDYFDDRIFMNIEMTDEMIDILDKQDYIMYKFSDFFDYKNIISVKL